MDAVSARSDIQNNSFVLTITWRRVAIVTLVIMALNFAISTIALAFVAIIGAHAIQWIQIPIVATTLLKSHLTIDQFTDSANFAFLAFSCVIFAPVCISIWGARSVILGRKLNSVIYLLLWFIFQLQWQLPSHNILVSIADVDFSLPILCISFILTQNILR